LSEHVLITGGAGFIGRAVSRELLSRGHRVRVLDSMIEQVHGDRERPEDFPDEAELIRGDVRNGDVVAKAIAGVDSIITSPPKSASASRCTRSNATPPSTTSAPRSCWKS
jgi:nucleoside-diphosphate-sugar epimerase